MAYFGSFANKLLTIQNETTRSELSRTLCFSLNAHEAAVLSVAYLFLPIL